MIAERIRAEAVRYGAEVGSSALAGSYSFGIEMGLAIAVAAGADAPAVLAELRAFVYHGAPDRWVVDEMDKAAAVIVAGQGVTL